MSTVLHTDSAVVEVMREFKTTDELWRRALIAVERLEARRRFDESLRLAVMERDAQRLFRDEALRCLQATEQTERKP